MKLFNKKSLILLISVISINILCIISVSYAYFTANIKGNEDAEEMVVKAGTMTITYADTNEVSLNNAIPGDSVTKQFKVENTGTLDAKYNIKIDINTNEFEDYSDLTYTLTKNGTPEEEKVLPYEDGYIVVQNEIASTTIDNYSLKVTFKKDETDQNDNANKKVDFTIVVDSNDEVKLYEYKEPYKDNSGANRPKLYQGMIPIRFTEENTMVIADITENWYDYDQHKWGNAVLIDNTNQDIVNKFYNEDGTLKINQAITEEDILQMYVWIPRYKYELFNVGLEGTPKQIINISFEKGVTSTGDVTCNISSTGAEICTNAINGNWYTHPAFTFGNTELPGIWVGKFEASDAEDLTGRNENKIGEITILPGKTSMTRKNISTAFFAEQALSNEGNKYNLKHDEVDTRVMKNMEWGAVTYMIQSIYGIYSSDGQTCMIDESMDKEICQVWINNALQGTGSTLPYPYGGTYTGCVGNNYNSGVQFNTNGEEPAKCAEGNRWNTGGVKASTTGNMYGIYDMSGGAWDYVMGVTINQIGTEVYYALSGFTKETMPDSKYYDLYEYDTNIGTYQRGHLGDATRETLKIFGNEKGGWNDGLATFPSDYSDYYAPWFVRGTCADNTINASVFSFGRAHGNAYIAHSFRSVLSAA